MKKNTPRLVIVGCAVFALLLALPLRAQDDWPEDCQLPDLEEAMSAANAAQADGDAMAYLDSLSDIAEVSHQAYGTCLGEIAQAGDDLVVADLREANLKGADLSGANLQEANLQTSNLQVADLSGANLQGANLKTTDLQGANLSDANLQGADLRYANLQWANLSGTNPAWGGTGTNLQDADLRYANLQGADLRYVNLQGAQLQAVNLQGADLIDANLQGADLRYANLQGAQLQAVNLQGADLTDAIFNENTFLPDAGDCHRDHQEDRWVWVCSSSWTPDTDMARFTDPEHPDFWRGIGLWNEDLRGMDFSNANLQWANLGAANVEGAGFSNANLHGARLYRANLEGADFSNANLQGAILEGTNLLYADLTDSIFDETTILPDAVRDEETRTYTSGYWTPETDMARFTDLAHPDFWDPCVEAWPPSYCYDSDE